MNGNKEVNNNGQQMVLDCTEGVQENNADFSVDCDGTLLGKQRVSILTNELDVHPAEVLATQLDRASILVNTMGELYNTSSENFAGGNGFIAHALVAITTLLNDAKLALENLHQTCDLNIVRSVVQDTTSTNEIHEAPLVFPPPTELWPSETEMLADEQIQSDENSVQFSGAGAVTAAAQDDNEFAQSYLELLRKLTAAEVFAAEQQALSPPGTAQNLLPLLRSLREEFQKLHRVA